MIEFENLDFVNIPIGMDEDWWKAEVIKTLRIENELYPDEKSFSIDIFVGKWMFCCTAWTDPALQSHVCWDNKYSDQRFIESRKKELEEKKRRLRDRRNLEGYLMFLLDERKKDNAN